jgi:hypothetical protein
MYLNHTVDQDFFDQISDNDQAGLLMKKTTVGVKDSSGDDKKNIQRLESFLQFTGYLLDLDRCLSLMVDRSPSHLSMRKTAA